MFVSKVAFSKQKQDFFLLVRQLFLRRPFSVDSQFFGEFETSEIVTPSNFSKTNMNYLTLLTDIKKKKKTKNRPLLRSRRTAVGRCWARHSFMFRESIRHSLLIACQPTKCKLKTYAMATASTAPALAKSVPETAAEPNETGITHCTQYK